MRTVVLLIAVLVAAPAHADTLYTYTGNTYGSMLSAYPNIDQFSATVSGPYTLDDHIVGSLLFAEDLLIPTNSHDWFAYTPLSYSFSDGVQTLTEMNSVIDFRIGGLSLPGGLGSSWVIAIHAPEIDGYVNSIISTVILLGEGSNAWEGANYFADFARVDPNPLTSPGNPGTWTVQQVSEPPAMLLIACVGVFAYRHHAKGRLRSAPDTLPADS